VYGKECPRSLENIKILFKYICLQLKENITWGGAGFVVFKIKYSSTKPVPHLSMKMYEYHHKTLNVITECINSHALEFTACNRCCWTGNVFLQIEQVHCHSSHHNLLQNVYPFATEDITAPYSTVLSRLQPCVLWLHTIYKAKCSLQLAGNSTHQCFHEFKTECKGHVSIIWPVTSNINIITVAMNAIHLQRHSDLALNAVADHIPQPQISVMAEYISECILIYLSLWHHRKWKNIM